MLRKHNGFTFVELTVVIIIIGIMMSVTVPRFGSMFSKASLGAAARRLAGTMGYLRNAAAKEGRSYFLNIDLETHEFWVTVVSEGADPYLINQGGFVDPQDEELSGYEEVADPFLRRTRLEKQIAFERIVLPNGAEVVEGRFMIEFRPDGTADETLIYMRNPKGKIYTLHLEQYNGQARLYKFAYAPDPLPELTEREPPERPIDAL
jgi:prepilin-type N-terminal cleavage/methylation domain-containing protein